jgi:hypothetical protein
VVLFNQLCGYRNFTEPTIIIRKGLKAHLSTNYLSSLLSKYNPTSVKSQHEDYLISFASQSDADRAYQLVTKQIANKKQLLVDKYVESDTGGQH